MNSTHYFAGIPSWKDTRPVLFRFVVFAGDMAAVGTAYLLAFAIRFHYGPFVDAVPALKGIPEVGLYLLAAPVVGFMWAVAISIMGGYRAIGYAALDELIRILRAGALGTVLAMSAMFLYRESSYSRVVFLLGGILATVNVYIFRELMKLAYLSWIQRGNRLHRILLLGNGRLGTSLHNILRKHRDKVVLRRNSFSVESIKRTITRSRIREVLVANPDIDHKLAVEIANHCEEHGVGFRLIPDILEIRMGEVVVDDSLGVPTFRLKSVSLHGSAFLAKRVMDVAIAATAIGFLFVPLVAICLAIKVTSPGPILYHHRRVGFKERVFNFFKFRTMVTNADDLLDDLKKKSDRAGHVFKMKRDPRITAVGRIMRRASLDELPQLINVLRGEMSLVGPRPQVEWEAALYDDRAKKRLNVLPGITGLWQVSGRAELTYDEMIDLDIFYIEHWSPGLDLKILLRTLPAILAGKGAY